MSSSTWIYIVAPVALALVLATRGLFPGFFGLVHKQMRQRALSTWLTLLSVTCGVGLAAAIMILNREGQEIFAQKSYGYDIIVGPPQASGLSLVLNTVYHMEKSQGNIPYSLYESMLKPATQPAGAADEPQPDYYQYVKIAVPYAVGDSYQGLRIVGTLPKLFGVGDDGKPLPPDQVLEYRPGERYEVDPAIVNPDGKPGRVFQPRKFEAIIGSDVTARTGLKIGDEFQAVHGLPAPNDVPEIHKPKWKVVGVLKRTHTANDRVIFIPLTSFYAIYEHDEGLQIQSLVRGGMSGEDAQTLVRERKQARKNVHAATQSASQPVADEDEDQYTLDPKDGSIILKLPKDQWEVSAILVKTRSAIASSQMMYDFQTRQGPVAVNPAMIMRQFFDTFLKGSTELLLIISGLVTVVAGIGILVSIYNSVSARMREIAILRALGATRHRVLGLICAEAGTVGLIGGVLGYYVGHFAAAVGSVYLNNTVGQGIPWWNSGFEELQYMVLVLIIAVVAGLVPAMKAYSTPVATNLTAV